MSMNDGARSGVGALGIAATLVTISTSAAGVLLDPVKMAFFFILSMVALAFASVRLLESTILDKNERPTYTRHVDKRWLAALSVVGLVAIAYVAVYFFGFLAPAESRVVYENFTPSENLYAALSMIEKAEGKKANCASRWDDHAPMFGAIEFLNDASRPVRLRPLEYADAVSYYQPDPHISFDLKKGPRVNELIVEDVLVEIIDFIPLPIFESEGAAAGVAESHEHILLYELSPPPCDSLPKSFSPTWHLADINNKTALKWTPTSRPHLYDDKSETFHVQLFSTVPGAYLVQLKAVVRAPHNRSKTLILTAPQWAVFTDVRFVRSIDDRILRKYHLAREEVTSEEMGPDGTMQTVTEPRIVEMPVDAMESPAAAPAAPEAPEAPEADAPPAE